MMSARGDGWQIDGMAVSANVVIHDAGVSVFWGNGYHFTIPDPLDVGGEAEASGRTLAPMPGQVKAVFVAPGDGVKTGDRLAILEAMKMEHTLRAGGGRHRGRGACRRRRSGRGWGPR